MTKEQDFKTRFTEVLRDLQQNGSKDAEAMFLLGSLAADLSDNMQSQTWSQAKASMTHETYDVLLKQFEEQGKLHHAEARDKHAYAVHALAVSLIARTQRADPHLASGEQLLDQIIDYTVAVYRQQKTVKPN